jgi:hypothetical protein
MKKPPITKKPMIVIRSKWGRWVSDPGAAGAGRPARSVLQPIREVCCRFAAGAAVGNNRFNK